MVTVDAVLLPENALDGHILKHFGVQTHKFDKAFVGVVGIYEGEGNIYFP